MSVTSTMEALARLLRPAPPPPAPGSASPAGDKMDVDGNAESPVDFLGLIKEDEKEDPVTPEELEALEKRIAEMGAPEPEKLAERGLEITHRMTDYNCDFNDDYHSRWDLKQVSRKLFKHLVTALQDGYNPEDEKSVRTAKEFTLACNAMDKWLEKNEWDDEGYFSSEDEFEGEGQKKEKEGEEKKEGKEEEQKK